MPINTSSSILADQEVGDATEERRRSWTRGTGLLDQLKGLRLGLLTGQGSHRRLAELSNTVRARRAEMTDPRLIEILDEIDVHAMIEAIKLEQYPG